MHACTFSAAQNHNWNFFVFHTNSFWSRKSLKLFETLLPDAADLKEKIVERVDEIKEQVMQNAERIIMSADTQVMRRIYDKETTAIDAAKISELYFRRLGPVVGAAGVGAGVGDSQNPKIINFINTVINIQGNQNDRPKTTSRVEDPAGGDDKGAKEVSVEGVVL